MRIGFGAEALLLSAVVTAFSSSCLRVPEDGRAPETPASEETSQDMDLRQINTARLRELSSQSKFVSSQPDRGLSLAGLDLTGEDLRKVDAAFSQFQDTDLSGANLEGANVAKSDFTGARLSKARLLRANISRAVLVDAILTDADMPWCTTRDLGPQLSCTRGFEIPHEHFQTHSAEVCEEGLSREELA